MKLCRQLCLAAVMAAGALAQGQIVPPLDHIVVNDPRIFNISDDGAVYDLLDGPVASGALSLVHGPDGALAGTIVVTDDHLNVWGPVALTGKLRVNGTKALSLRLAGGGPGEAKIKITGSYDAPLKLMRVVVIVKTPEKLRFQWNDAFVPEHADLTGFTLDRTSVASNAQNKIKGQHLLVGPGINTLVNSQDLEVPNSDFQLKAPGVKLFGDYNLGPNTFSVNSSKTSIGYGSVFTPGSLVTITSDNLFPRIF